MAIGHLRPAAINDFYNVNNFVIFILCTMTIFPFKGLAITR